MRSIRSSGWEIVSFCVPWGGVRPPRKEKIPGGGVRGGMVTGQIEPCIRRGKPFEC